MFTLLSDFKPINVFTRFIAARQHTKYSEDNRDWNDLSEQEKSSYSINYLEEKFQEIAAKNPEYFSERFTRQEETIRKINLSIADEIKKDTDITPQ